MFGISAAEFLVVLVVAVAVIPARQWPYVARIAARCVRFIRDLVWKVSDSVEAIKTRVELEKPIDDLLRGTADDVAAAFSRPAGKKKAKTKIVK